MLNQALIFTFRNFSTLFLLVMVVFLPLHVIQDRLWSDVVGVAELHDEVETLREDASVNGVKPGDLAGWRTAGWVILVAELAALPLLVRAARRVLLDDTSGKVPTVVGSLPAALSGGGSGGIGRVRGPVTVIVLIAAASTLLARETALTLGLALSDDWKWLASALGEASSRALGGALLAGGLAYLFTEVPPEKRSASGNSTSTLDDTNV